jgi:hypothetical protein
LIEHFKVDLVVHGQTSVLPDIDGKDPYEVRRRRRSFYYVY